MNFYAYIPTEKGKEPMGTANRKLFTTDSPQKAITQARKALGEVFKLYSYTNLYNDKTFKLVMNTWKK